MKALLTACTAIACAVTQVSWNECPQDDATSLGLPCERGASNPSPALRSGAGSAPARSAGDRASPRVSAGEER